MSLRSCLLIGLAASAAACLLWFTDLPLGIPGEWTWARVPLEAGQTRELLWGLAIAGFGGVVYLAFAAFGARRVARASRFEAAAWLGGLAGIGFLLLSAIQNASPEPYGLSKATWVLYYPRSSGYFFESRYHMGDVRRFLAGYEERIASGKDVLHLGTHPPGLFLFHRGLSELCRRFPGLADAVSATQPAGVEAAFDAIAQNESIGATPLLPDDRASIWLSALVTQFIAAATLVPLYLLVRRRATRESSWMTAAFWPVIPALAVFLPKSDVLYPFFAVTFVWLWLSGFEKNCVVRSVLAGVVLWCGMLVSLTMLPVAAFGTAALFWEWGSDRVRQRSDPAQARPGRRFLCEPSQRLVLALICAFGAFCAATLLFSLAFDIRMPAVWLGNLRNHSQFYAHSPRTYWKWLLVNPLELAIAAGLPVAILAARASATAFRHSRGNQLAPYVAFAAVFATLWLSGKNMGEAARLWLFLQPWLLLLAAPCFARRAPGAGPIAPDAESTPARGEGRSPAPGVHPWSARFAGWLFLLALQFLASLATAARIDGFHLSEL